MTERSDPEVMAMNRCVKGLDSLDGNTRIRVLDWLRQRYVSDKTYLKAMGEMAEELTNLESQSKDVPPGGVKPYEEE